MRVLNLYPTPARFDFWTMKLWFCFSRQTNKMYNTWRTEVVVVVGVVVVVVVGPKTVYCTKITFFGSQHVPNIGFYRCFLRNFHFFIFPKKSETWSQWRKLKLFSILLSQTEVKSEIYANFGTFWLKRSIKMKRFGTEKKLSEKKHFCHFSCFFKKSKFWPKKGRIPT